MGLCNLHGNSGGGGTADNYCGGYMWGAYNATIITTDTQFAYVGEPWRRSLQGDAVEIVNGTYKAKVAGRYTVIYGVGPYGDQLQTMEKIMAVGDEFIKIPQAVGQTSMAMYLIFKDF